MKLCLLQNARNSWLVGGVLISKGGIPSLEFGSETLKCVCVECVVIQAIVIFYILRII